ncbi:MAG: sensor histidine kinase [Cyanobacteria bacterium J06634_6]
MTSLVRFPDPSLRFLLWLEWILLGLTALGEIRQRFWLFDERSPLLSLVCIALLCVLGLRLPQKKLSTKLVYAALNLSLVLIASLIGQVQFFFLLCVVLMLRSCLVFGAKGRWLTMAAMFGIFVVVQSYRVQSLRGQFLTDDLQWNAGDATRPLMVGASLLFVLVLVFLQLMIGALLAERTSRQQLAIANTQLRQYALQVEEIATLKERTRVAREIHDALGHSLTALGLNLSAAIGLWAQAPQEAKSLVSQAQSLSQSALTDVRQAIAMLRAEAIASKPLGQLLRDLVTELQRNTNLQPHGSVQIDHDLSEAQKTAVYRIVQEGLTNIAKHAQATKVTVEVQTAEKTLTIVIRDNGRGFNRSQTTSGFGLRGMEERVLALEGTLVVDTAPDEGCCIFIQLPLMNC